MRAYVVFKRFAYESTPVRYSESYHRAKEFLRKKCKIRDRKIKHLINDEHRSNSIDDMALVDISNLKGTKYFIEGIKKIK